MLHCVGNGKVWGMVKLKGTQRRDNIYQEKGRKSCFEAWYLITYLEHKSINSYHIHLFFFQEHCSKLKEFKVVKTTDEVLAPVVLTF